MFSSIVLAAVASAALANAPAPTVQPMALAKGATYATLAAPLARPVDTVFDGRIWHCEGQTCRAGSNSTARAQSTTRECSAVAKRLGAFETYQTGSEMLSADALATCNAAAKR